ncbi:ATP-dependent Clp protease ATP-binding subunit ClpC1 [Phycisphaerae bacterium RAS1]|nr:ATP-dependent Clp protease ATP-binding subunit ClpC1 [Phycisphaerae bacterium RAS1]
MQRPHLDGDAKTIVKLADEIAREYELDYVGTEHVLLAILRHGSGLGARVLAQFKIDEAGARQEVDELLKRSLDDTWVFGRLPGSPHFRNVIERAIDESAQLESSEIRSEHLLLALLREKDSTAQLVLEKLGVTLKKAREEVLRQLGAKR